MQAVTEDFFGCTVIFRILDEYRCTGKAEYLKVVEEIDDILMTFSEMASVTLIKNHHYLFVAHILNMSVVIVFCNRTIELLDSGYYDF